MNRTTNIGKTHPAIPDNTVPAHRDTQQVFLHSHLCTSWLSNRSHCPIICNMGRYSVTPFPLPALRLGGRTSWCCSLRNFDHYKSIHTSPEASIPLASGLFLLHFFFLCLLPSWSKIHVPSSKFSIQKIIFKNFVVFCNNPAIFVIIYLDRIIIQC